MSKYKIFETNQFMKDLEQISRSGRVKIVSKLREFVYPKLRESPYFGPQVKKLKGFDPETWRYRIGAWRFFYEIDQDEGVVYMIAAHHRSVAY